MYNLIYHMCMFIQFTFLELPSLDMDISGFGAVDFSSLPGAYTLLNATTAWLLAQVYIVKRFCVVLCINMYFYFVRVPKYSLITCTFSYICVHIQYTSPRYSAIDLKPLLCPTCTDTTTDTLLSTSSRIAPYTLVFEAINRLVNRTIYAVEQVKDAVKVSSRFMRAVVKAYKDIQQNEGKKENVQ